MPFFAILGPRDAGPGERDRMLEAAATALEESGVDDHVRIDVPGRGAGEAGDGNLREPVHLVVPALQSGSLFGGGGGVLVVDAENLQKAEAEVIAELVAAADPDHVTGVFVAAGSIRSMPPITTSAPGGKKSRRGFTTSRSVYIPNGMNRKPGW